MSGVTCHAQHSYTLFVFLLSHLIFCWLSCELDFIQLVGEAQSGARQQQSMAQCKFVYRWCFCFCSSPESRSEVQTVIFCVFFVVFFNMTFTSKTHINRSCSRATNYFVDKFASLVFIYLYQAEQDDLSNSGWLMLIIALQHKCVTVCYHVSSGDCGGGLMRCWSDVTDWLVNNVSLKAKQSPLVNWFPKACSMVLCNCNRNWPWLL